MKKILSFLTTAFLLLPSFSLSATEITDSVKFCATENWKSIDLGNKSVTARQAVFDTLFSVPQSVSVVEIAPDGAAALRVGVCDSMINTSVLADRLDAMVAVNGSFFNMKKGNSVCFLKIDDTVIDSTYMTERCDGAIICLPKSKKADLIKWTKEIECNYPGVEGEVLVSGPMLIYDNAILPEFNCSKGFSETRHPRTAIGSAPDGTFYLVTVDGRSKGNAEGMSLEQMAKIMKWLGCSRALNFDGGGSTTLWSAKEGILNYPSDNKRFDHQGERRVPNIIYVTLP